SMIRIYGKDAASACKTKAELIEENRGQSSGLITVFIIIIIMGLSMTIIGVTSNQIIGFEGRKKESAVLLSTAMNKKTLMGILLKESFMVSVVSGAVGTLLGVGLAKVFKNALDHTESIVMDINTDPDKCLLFFAILVIVFTFTVLFPIRNLRKMKISEQIKYE
ncbi:MAG: ABC transporter permease, partial [Clostridiales bacterium]|nr:ABC transporter permease [Clostridiales bacterium]